MGQKNIKKAVRRLSEEEGKQSETETGFPRREAGTDISEFSTGASYLLSCSNVSCQCAVYMFDHGTSGVYHVMRITYVASMAAFRSLNISITVVIINN
jgi:hypothetical protein